MRRTGKHYWRDDFAKPRKTKPVTITTIIMMAGVLAWAGYKHSNKSELAQTPIATIESSASAVSSQPLLGSIYAPASTTNSSERVDKPSPAFSTNYSKLSTQLNHAEPVDASIKAEIPEVLKAPTTIKPAAPKLKAVAVTNKTVQPALQASKPAQPAKSITPKPSEWRLITVNSGDTFSTAMDSAGFGVSHWLPLVNLDKNTKLLSRVKAGDTIRIKGSDKIEALEYKINSARTLHVKRQGDKLVSQLDEAPIRSVTKSASGVIKTAFYPAAKSAGMADNLIMEMAEMFAWDLNFALDMRSGDRFNVVYQQDYREKLKVGKPHILAAEIVNRGRTLRAVRYTDPKGYTDYYTPEGRSMRQAFLNSPVHFTRISSKFNPNRLHPVFKTKSPHRGVDYAAPRGTKISAAGDGIVAFAGKKTGYGNVVILKHGDKYQTLYAHMNGFAKNISKGRRVSQGQTIGYVGSTGWATGPHLHYEFLVDGHHKNPLTVKLPKALPIASRYKKDFLAHSEPMMDWLDALGSTQLAYNQQQ